MIRSLLFHFYQLGTKPEGKNDTHLTLAINLELIPVAF
jgi:hypothetical protein